MAVAIPRSHREQGHVRPRGRGERVGVLGRGAVVRRDVDVGRELRRVQQQVFLAALGRVAEEHDRERSRTHA